MNMYITTVNCPATWAATVCLRGLTNVCCTSVCPISGIRCVQTMVFLCPNNGIWCVQTMVFLCVQTMVFGVSKQWYLVCPNNGIWCVQTMVFLCVQTMVFLCVQTMVFLSVQTMVFGVPKQWYLVCPNNGIWCVQSMVFGVFKQWGLCMFKQWYLVCPNKGIQCVQTVVFLCVQAMVFFCVQTVMWLPLIRICNVWTSVSACNCTQGLYRHFCDSVLIVDLEKNSLLQWGVEPVSRVCHAWHLTVWTMALPLHTCSTT